MAEKEDSGGEKKAVAATEWKTSGSRQIGGATPVPLPFVKNTLLRREKEGELHYEQKLALEYARKFAKIDEKTADKLVESLEKLDIPRFKRRHAVKIVDVMPEDKTGLKAVFSKESITLNNEQIEKVLSLLNKHRPQAAAKEK